MTEYIEREYVLKCMEDSYKNAGISAEAKAKMMRWLNKAPAADVRPVVPGKWERMFDNDVFGDIHCKCSACGEDWWQGPGWFRNANFCPNCGAMMEES